MAIMASPVAARPVLSPSAKPWGLGLPAIAANTPETALPMGDGADQPIPAADTPPPLPEPAFAGYAGGMAPSLLTLGAGGDRDRARDCMTLAIAYEAGNQPLAGQQAVGQVILNRVRDPRFPKSVCGVVFAGSERVTGCQFTFTCDGSIRRRLADTTMLMARIVAEEVLDGAAPDRVGGATHYHADYVLPYWALSGTPVARIGAHIFYRMPGGGARLTPAVAMARPEPAIPALAQAMTRALQPGRGGLRARMRAARMAMGGIGMAPAGGHAMFAPWGLPVTAGQ